MNNKDDKKKLEEKYLMLQLLDAQIKELEKELSALEVQSKNILNLKESLTSLEKSKENSRGFSAIGAGIYSESDIKDTKNVLVNVGAGVLVKKSVPETSKLLDKQITQSQEITKKLAANIQTLSEKAVELQMEVQDLVKANV